MKFGGIGNILDHGGINYLCLFQKKFTNFFGIPLLNVRNLRRATDGESLCATRLGWDHRFDLVESLGNILD